MHKRPDGGTGADAPTDQASVLGRLTPLEIAARAGVSGDFVVELLDAGLLGPAADGSLGPADVRRIRILRGLVDAGLPLAGLSEGTRRGVLSLDFVSAPEYERFGGLSDETFAAAATRTGVPVGLLTCIRGAIGLGDARPDDLVREDEQAVVGFVASQHRAGFRDEAIERLLRVLGDALRRVAEAEAEWWRSEVLEPGLEGGMRADGLGAGSLAAELSAGSEATLLAVYHAQQEQTWVANILAGFTYLLSEAGLHRAREQLPAICFLDITGYTRLTQERGDRAAAEVADALGRLVREISQRHGGRPVKWLGDGVMCHFPDPDHAVSAALEMVSGIDAAGLPPAHVGVHAGPVVLRDGDFYGQTVNVAARITDYARPREVLVSQAVVDAARDVSVDFREVGNIELKGVLGAVRLHAARPAPRRTRPRQRPSKP
jgi:adenylate cyclase